MKVKLLPHQRIGVSWMIDQERQSPHRGGILADDMGLGKTIQMISLMVSDYGARPNLVIACVNILLAILPDLTLPSVPQ